MIKTVRDKRVAVLLAGERPKHFPADVTQRALIMLARLDAALRLEDLRVPPGNRLEALSGRRAGQHSLRLNNQWRLCFVWRDGDAFDVEIVDYH